MESAGINVAQGVQRDAATREQQQKIRENEKLEMKELIEKYQQNLEKIDKAKKVVKQVNAEQNEIKEKIKEFMKRYTLNNIFTQDGGKIVYQVQNVQRPINKKFLEKRVLELMGDINGREFMRKILGNVEATKREHIIFKVGKTKRQVYV
jgi:predicted acetyltransferase